jgi:hypothetical protein
MSENDEKCDNNSIQPQSSSPDPLTNAIMIFFKIDKKYYLLNTTLERLRTEGWQYFQLTGRYSGHLIDHDTPTHENQFVHFCHFVEKLKMRQVADEYLKNDEKASQAPQNTNNNDTNENDPLSRFYSLSSDSNSPFKFIVDEEDSSYISSDDDVDSMYNNDSDVDIDVSGDSDD